MAITTGAVFYITIIIVSGFMYGQEALSVPRMAKSRSKRNYLLFPSASTLQLTIGVSAALDLIGNPTGQLSYAFQQNVALPSNITEILYPRITRVQRGVHVYHHLLGIFQSYRINGTECLKKAICQVASAPFEGGLFEEILNFIFTPSSHEPWEHSENVDDSFLLAEFIGRNSGDCYRTFPHCGETPLDLISLLEKEII